MGTGFYDHCWPWRLEPVAFVAPGSSNWTRSGWALRFSSFCVELQPQRQRGSDFFSFRTFLFNPDTNEIDRIFRNVYLIWLVSGFLMFFLLHRVRSGCWSCFPSLIFLFFFDGTDQNTNQLHGASARVADAAGQPGGDEPAAALLPAAGARLRRPGTRRRRQNRQTLRPQLGRQTRRYTGEPFFYWIAPSLNRVFLASIQNRFSYLSPIQVCVAVIELFWF